MEFVERGLASSPDLAMLDKFRTDFEKAAMRLAQANDERREQAPYCRSIARFLGSVHEKTTLDEADRVRLFEYIYAAWSEFRTEADLPRAFGPAHSRTADNGNNFVSSLLAQAFDQAQVPERAEWIRSARAGFLPYFVSRYISESMLEVMANDPLPGVRVSARPEVAPIGMFADSSFSHAFSPLPRRANELGSNSAEIFLELARVMDLMRREAASAEAATILLSQQKTLTRFIVAARARIDHDSPKPQEDYDLICRFFEEELAEIVKNDVEAAMRAGDLVPVMIQTIMGIFSKFCVELHMLRYECWAKECEVKIIEYLRGKYSQAR